MSEAGGRYKVSLAEGTLDMLAAVGAGVEVLSLQRESVSFCYMEIAKDVKAIPSSER